ncbi:MAG: hypothetical protein M3P70_05520 [Actinomycetota bacterium]|nr:hypothetical protein [Actinomycetota bacterium]
MVVRTLAVLCTPTIPWWRMSRSTAEAAGETVEKLVALHYLLSNRAITITPLPDIIIKL